MLPRAFSRSLRVPALRAAPSNLHIASTQWVRSIGSNHRCSPTGTAIDYSRLPRALREPRLVAIDLQWSAGTRNSFSTRHSRPRSGNRQDNRQDSSVKQSQDNLKSAVPNPENEASRSKAPQETDSVEDLAPNQPLQDLTRGIPSTLEHEATGSTAAGRPASTVLNLTEDPVSSSGGRGRGELPASAYISSSERKRLQVANYMYAGFAVACIFGYIYLGRNWESDDEELRHPDSPSGWSIVLMWRRAKERLGNQLSYYKEPAFKKLLPDPDPSFERPYTLVLSLEDLLVHSEWSREHGWRMAKRPGVDYFLRYLSQYYELVIFTTVPWAIGEPVIRKLDPYRIVTWPLFREATMYRDGEYVKDLSYLNRDLSKVIIVDTDASHTREQPGSAIILPKWKGDPKDKELVSLIPFLEYIPTMGYRDVREVLKTFEGTYIPAEFAKREAIARKKFEEQIAEERKKRPHSGLGALSRVLGVKPTYMMVEPGELTPAEAFAQGKMLQDQARERGQKNYEALEKMIREEGEKWLKEEAAHEEMAKQEGMKAMKSGLTGFFGLPSSKSKDA